MSFKPNHHFADRYVYFLRVGSFLKIGSSNDPWRRLKLLPYDGTAWPDGLDKKTHMELIGVMRGVFRTEVFHHQMCWRYQCRSAGEWYHWCDDLERYINNRPIQYEEKFDPNIPKRKMRPRCSRPLPPLGWPDIWALQ